MYSVYDNQLGNALTVMLLFFICEVALPLAAEVDFLVVNVLKVDVIRLQICMQ